MMVRALLLGLSIVVGAGLPPAESAGKTRVAVGKFDNKVTGIFRNWQLGEGFAEILTTELLSSGRFVVLERAALSDVLDEQALGQSGLVRSEGAAQTGQLLGAQVIVTGAVTEFSDAASGYGVRGGIDSGGSDVDASFKSKDALVGIDLRVVDATTGQVIAAEHVAKKAPSRGASINYEDSDFQNGANGFYRTPLGQATRAAMAEAVRLVARTVPAQQIDGRLKVVKSDGQVVYINGGTNKGIAPGSRFVVKSAGEALIDPDTGLPLGEIETTVGVIQIVTVQEKFAIGQVVSGGGFKRGDVLVRQ